MCAAATAADSAVSAVRTEPFAKPRIPSVPKRATVDLLVTNGIADIKSV
jgi:hypothetical protein